MADTSTKYDNYSLDDIYAEAEDLNDPEVLLGIAHHYRDGNGVDKDENKYLSYLKQAVDAGSDKAKTELESYSENNPENEQKPSKSEKNDNPNKSSDDIDMTLSGNEDMDELIRLADDGNYMACYQLWQKAIKYHSDSEANKYLNRLIDYVTDGSTANKYKSYLAVKLGDYYRDKIDFKKYNSFEKSDRGKITYRHRNDEDILLNINNAKKYYDIGRELGNKEATIDLINLLCNLEDPVAAEAVFRQSDIIDSEDKNEILVLLYKTYNKIGGFKLKMTAIVEEINKDPEISNDDKHFINMCNEIDNHGWNCLFNNYTDSLYAFNIKNHFSNSYSIKALTLDEFQKMVYIYRKSYKDQLLSFLAMSVVYGNDEIQQYVFNNAEEFKNGTLLPEILKIQGRYSEEYAKEKAIRASKNYIIQRYNSFKDFLYDSNNANYIKVFYETPDDLKDLSDGDLNNLFQFYRYKHDFESLNKTICNAINDGNKSHYNIAVNTNEFKSPNFGWEPGDVKTERAYKNHISVKKIWHKTVYFSIVIIIDIILYIIKLRTSALIYANIIVFGTPIIYLFLNLFRNRDQRENEFWKMMIFASIYVALIIINGFAMNIYLAIFCDAVLGSAFCFFLNDSI